MIDIDMETQRLVELDHAHLWHPFTPMKQWRAHSPLMITAGEGFHLVDSEGRRYIDGVSSLWCNVHGHRVPEIDQAIRDQLDRIAHSTLLGLGSPPAIAYAAKLAATLQRHLPCDEPARRLNKVFYSDAGATAVEVAFKMAVGYWYHRGKAQKNRFIGLQGAYHGDTTGAMSVGYSPLFHRAFISMVFDVTSFPSPDPCRPPARVRQILEEWERRLCPDCIGKGHCGLPVWPSECRVTNEALMQHSMEQLRALLEEQAEQTAAIVIEPIMQGAAGMICQPPGFVQAVADMAREFDVLLIADEVATGFGRTGKLFACEHDQVSPDIICLAKGISAGYLPLAATVCSDQVEQAFCGELDEKKTLYHGHTYTGNPLACVAALASLELFERDNVMGRAEANAALIGRKLDELREHPNIMDIRQRGLMVGIELCRNRDKAEPFDFSKRTAYQLCDAMRQRGLIVRPLGDVLILMPAPAMPEALLEQMLDIVVETLQQWTFE